MTGGPAEDGVLKRLFWRLIDWIGRNEKSVLVAGLLVVGGVWGFVALADEVNEGETQAFDEWVLRQLRTPGDLSDPIGDVWVEEAARDITALGGVTVLVLVTVSVVVALGLQRRRGTMWLVVGSTLGGALLTSALKDAFDRQRPGVVPHLTEVLTASFPSGHAMLSAVVYLTLGALLARLVRNTWARAWCLLVAMGITVLVGLSRLYLGVHYPTDVLGGWVAGMAWALACWLLARWLQRRGTVERPGPARS
ncbi:phosphatase PAP2 family protein [Vulgatibacter sp.]|uniref:phosphatase PAP2 family protein n=1 Tax=Vulgatibacter sp. TaxID=1971226 RepID=UPI0035686365